MFTQYQLQPSSFANMGMRAAGEGEEVGEEWGESEGQGRPSKIAMVAGNRGDVAPTHTDTPKSIETLQDDQVRNLLGAKKIKMHCRCEWLLVLRHLIKFQC